MPKYQSRTGRVVDAPKRQFDFWHDAPFAMAICKDGRELLLNAFHEPLQQRRPGGLTEPVPPPHGWFGHAVRMVYFYDPADPPAQQRRDARAAARRHGWPPQWYIDAQPNEWVFEHDARNGMPCPVCRLRRPVP
jgi:hypothetical protein